MTSFGQSLLSYRLLTTTYNTYSFDDSSSSKLFTVFLFQNKFDKIERLRLVISIGTSSEIDRFPILPCSSMSIFSFRGLSPQKQSRPFKIMSKMYAQDLFSVNKRTLESEYKWIFLRLINKQNLSIQSRCFKMFLHFKISTNDDCNPPIIFKLFGNFQFLQIK